MSKLLLFVSLLFFSTLRAQPNCEAFLYAGDTLKYEACQAAMKAAGHYQFSKEYQKAMDKALEIDSTFDYPYWAKSIAYLKSGDFIHWKLLIDQAVSYNPEMHLGYRGWCRYQFFRDYKGAIEDIEQLDKLTDYDIGLSQNGRYHLHIARGLCYKAIGEKQKALEIIENQVLINEEKKLVGSYDYLHLGVLYFEMEDYNKALSAFQKQSSITPLAENQYYLALVYRSLGRSEEYLSCLYKSKELYLSDSRMFDPYSNPLDRIYLADITSEIDKASLPTK